MNPKKRPLPFDSPTQPQVKRSARIASRNANTKVDENGSRVTPKQTKNVATKPALTAKQIGQPAEPKPLFAMAPYANEIFLTELENERKFFKQINQGIRWSRLEITADMRSILVHWLIDVTDEYGMQKQTLFLAVNYVDRFLNLYQHPVPSTVLQLLGVSCLLVAAKYEEIEVPRLEELIYFADDGYSASEILETESVILNGLDFDLTVSTVLTFLPRFLQVVKASTEASQYATCLAELSLTYYNLVMNFPPSRLAASIVCLSRHKFNETNLWPEAFLSHTGYSKSELTICMKEIWVAHRRFSIDPQNNSTVKFANFFPSAMLPK